MLDNLAKAVTVVFMTVLTAWFAIYGFLTLKEYKDLGIVETKEKEDKD